MTAVASDYLTELVVVLVFVKKKEAKFNLDNW